MLRKVAIGTKSELVFKAASISFCQPRQIALPGPENDVAALRSGLRDFKAEQRVQTCRRAIHLDS
jgi:hypothetical protein